MSVDDLLKGLNEKQKEAVCQTEGPVLILAGAGSGKTKVLTHRLAYIIKELKVDKSNVAAITFTNKAAQEMGGRIIRLLGYDMESFQRQPSLAMYQLLPWVGTFHSVCVRILRAQHEVIGIPKNFTIFDYDDTLSALRSIIKELNYDTKQYHPSAIGSLISSAKNELMSPDEYAEFVQGPFQQVALEAYRRYRRLLDTQGALDFDDLIMVTVKMLEQFQSVRSFYNEQFQYIMIDEYQDTNFAQYRLAQLLTNNKRPNICVVGDDYQAIYGWRGANYQNIIDFGRDYPDAKIFKLEQNYRSTKTILEGANHIAKHLKKKSEKRLWTDNEQGPPITIFEAQDPYQEAQFISDEMRALKALGYSWSDFALLYRINAQSRVLEEVLLSKDIPYRLVGALRFYERREIKDLIAYLRLIFNRADRISYERIVNVPARGIGAQTLKKGGEKLVSFEKMMEELRQESEGLGTQEILKKVIDKIKFRSYLCDGTIEGEGRWENVEEMLNLAAEYPEIEQFLEHVALISEVDNYNQSAEAVTLMTVHCSKGLEFTCVFLLGMEEGLFPHSRSFVMENEMDEERRLCYVGMTRAKKRLYLTYAQSRITHGLISSNMPSRFLEEIDSSLTERI